MNKYSNSYATVRQNRLSKKRNVIGLYNLGRSVSLNQLNTDYVNQWYKEQYFILKEQYDQTKQQFNKQQEQLKQLNCKLKRLLEEKKDFLNQFVHYSQVNAGLVVEELEMNNLKLEKENKRLKDQLLLAQVRAASAGSRGNANQVMIINMKQHLQQTNYGWVKARIDSGLNDRTKRNPFSGQLIRERVDNQFIDRSTNKSISDRSANRSIINKERHHVSFSNQLEQEHLYEDDFEQDEENWSSENSLENDTKTDEMRKISKNNFTNDKLKNQENLSDNDDLELNYDQLVKAKNQIKKLEEIVYLQQQFIDKQQELSNQTDNLDSSKEPDNWFNKENYPTNIETNNFETKYSNLISNSSSSFSSSSSIIEFESIQQTVGGNNTNELQIEELNELNIIGKQSNKIKQQTDQLVSTNYSNKNSKNLNNRKSSKNNESNNLNTNEISDKIDKLLSGEKIDKKTPESTKSIFGDDETSSTSISTLEQLTLSVLANQDEQISSEDDKEKMKTNRFLISSGSERSRRISKNYTDKLFENLTKQLEAEKVKNEQLEARNRHRLSELEQNINELGKENEILRSSLEKCIQGCLTEIESELG